MFFRPISRTFVALLNKKELEVVKKELSTWTFNQEKAINKRFNFKNFKEAWEFMSLIAKVADQHDHHPEWSNVYNKVDVLLTTHSAGGLTSNDVWLAKFMDKAETLVKHEHED